MTATAPMLRSREASAVGAAAAALRLDRKTRDAALVLASRGIGQCTTALALADGHQPDRLWLAASTYRSPAALDGAKPEAAAAGHHLPRRRKIPCPFGIATLYPPCRCVDGLAHCARRTLVQP
eukprot:3360876-Prymnesium_polylepis.1